MITNFKQTVEIFIYKRTNNAIIKRAYPFVLHLNSLF